MCRQTGILIHSFFGISWEDLLFFWGGEYLNNKSYDESKEQRGDVNQIEKRDGKRDSCGQKVCHHC